MSELHNRLEHLVNYSSQLIFVSGDTVADQQRILSDFLASQQENTEISFVTASANKQASDYRSAICRQLAGHTVGSFVRPLNQLLADLPANDGPYLVCITAADYLEESFLQELWDWVMHSQQVQDNIHLNVILFGKSDWAESSQEWLPSQNSHKPVLLSSQSVNSSGFDVNALEALMANDSNWFNFSSGPVVSNKWFIGGVLSVFFATFVALIAWQYPQEINQLLTQGEITSLKEKQELPVFDIATNDNQQQGKAAIATIENTSANQQPTEPYTLQLELVDEQSEQGLSSTAEATSEESPVSITDDLLVRTWQQGITSEQYTKGVTQTSNDEAQDSKGETQVQTEASTAKIQNSTPINQDGDFKVPDIISVEQLDRQLASKLASQVSTVDFLNTPEQKASVQNETVQSLDDEVFQSSLNQGKTSTTLPTESTVNNTSSLYRFDESTLLNLPTDAILLQLSGIQNPVVLENYLASNNLKANTWIYETERYGGPWYVVVYRQSFESIDAALNRMNTLPASVRNAGPFAKSANQIQQEIQVR